MLGSALLLDRPIQAVCDQMHLVILDHEGKTTISSAVLIQVRDRLGSVPLKTLFDVAVARHGRERPETHRWLGLAV